MENAASVPGFAFFPDGKILASRTHFAFIARVQEVRAVRNKLILILGLSLLVLVWQTLSRGKLTVYCAHDAVFAEQIIRDFEKKTGIPVEVKFDTEATKSLGLVERIIRDRKNPRCDVFWNNEMLGTLDLAERGLLEPWQGKGWNRIPAAWRDNAGRWAGFAARLRMEIRREDAGEFPNPAKPGSLEKFAIAKPLYGTTLTHFSAMWSLLGPDAAREWHTQLRRRGVQIVNGNAAVRDIVAAGTCTAGWTDTDDFFDAKDAKKPVTAAPIILENGGTICIPNTVAIIKGTSRQSHARAFADFVLSAQTELALAKSKSRQIPLGALTEAQATELPADVRDLIPAAHRGIPLAPLLKARNECLEWLKGEYLK